ncbi:hypothetical protein GOP47_0014715 [Adiantum capillus-veneris]|uniref:Uncharacterized protein n=1 Tax=Adiantum capillus-veneris TaxID=13818 RepID=A0A9D4ZDR8_ADICA|nr:hypothetical protein GOP47_0014715 [Adiantum capillus-veneris]
MGYASGVKACAYQFMKRREDHLQQGKEDEDLQNILPLVRARFSYEELRAATKGFGKLLDAGGCGSVYAGTFWDGRRAAVKYKYVERGSLDRWLFEEEKDSMLDWQKRICCWILVFVAKISDFGMSKLVQRDMSYAVIGVRGTPCYIALEWFCHGIVSKKMDIYSLWMVIVKIVDGRKLLVLALWPTSCKAFSDESRQVPIIVGSGHALRWHLPSWVSERLEQGAVMEVVDKRLRDSKLKSFCTFP